MDPYLKTMYTVISATFFMLVILIALAKSLQEVACVGMAALMTLLLVCLWEERL